MLRPYHHRLMHEGGFTVEHLDDGALRFLRPDGQAIAPPPSTTPDAATLVDHNRGRGLAISAETAVSKWQGERFDYHHTINILMQCASTSEARADC